MNINKKIIFSKKKKTVDHFVCDNSSVVKDFKWYPKVSIENGLAKYFKWYKSVAKINNFFE